MTPNSQNLVLICIAVMIASLIGVKNWNKHSRELQGQSKNMANILQNIFLYSVTLSNVPAELAMRWNLPAWQKFVKCMDDVRDVLDNLVPRMICYEGDGILSRMASEGMSEDDIIRIVMDLMIAAGDTVSLS